MEVQTRLEPLRSFAPLPLILPPSRQKNVASRSGDGPTGRRPTNTSLAGDAEVQVETERRRRRGEKAPRDGRELAPLMGVNLDERRVRGAHLEAISHKHIL